MDRSKLLKKYGFKEELTEVERRIHAKTGFPKPLKSYKLDWEVYDLSLEEPYFWVLGNLKKSFYDVVKLEDSFAAAENSAFFGVTQLRLGGQQDKISQFLATVGKMIKELFQMVRELRIIDERLAYYNKAAIEINKPMNEREKGAEITLKGFFVDLVQGGAKSAASVFGMSRELEFVTLPDLFFDAPPFVTQTELENYVDALGKDFNRNVIRVLKRHLTQFMEWKKRTSQEHVNRRRFMLQYLLQHYEIIRMYITWIKPYLRHVSKLTMKGERMESPDLIAAFEGSMLDVEILARKRVPVDDDEKFGANGCVLATFYYRTRPEMKVVQEGYQRGPIHIGRYEMQIRVYGWTDEEVENYKKLKEEEIFLTIGDVSSTIQKAMDSLGDELKRYLDEAKKRAGVDSEDEEEVKEKVKKSFMEKYFGDFYTPKEKKKEEVLGGLSVREIKAYEKKVKSQLKAMMPGVKYVTWNIYKTFKKAHAMVQW